MAALPAPNIVQQIYYSAYVLFFRITRRTGDKRVGLSVGAISVAKCLAIMGLICWYEILQNRRSRLENWQVLVLYLVIYGLDFWFLVVRAGGTRFEERFDQLPRERRVFLRLSAAVLVVACFVFGIGSVMVYRRAFGID